MDRSHHGWFDGQEDKACLMNMVDDATGRILSLMSPEETTSLNEKFAVEPRSPADFHRLLPQDLDLGIIFCLEV
jgi:predicted transcriptional regulator